jgi:hypothetical protein
MTTDGTGITKSLNHNLKEYASLHTIHSIPYRPRAGVLNLMLASTNVLY